MPGQGRQPSPRCPLTSYKWIPHSSFPVLCPSVSGLLPLLLLTLDLCARLLGEPPGL